MLSIPIHGILACATYAHDMLSVLKVWGQLLSKPANRVLVACDFFFSSR